MAALRENVLSPKYQRVIDNRQISMLDAFNDLLPVTKNLDLAVAYFYFSGLRLVEGPITNLVERGGTIRLLMGNRTNYTTAELLTEGHFLKTATESLIDELKYLEEDDERCSLAHQFCHWIRDGKVEVRVYVGNANYFHAKSYLMYSMESRDPYHGYAIVGSSNLSESGLQGNTELNTVSQDNFGALARWFDTIWNSNEVRDFSDDLLTVINEYVPKPPSLDPPPDDETRRHDYPHPYETYLTFARYFAKAIPEEITGHFMETLYRHQAIGVSEMKLRLEQYGTGVLCDGVGLGKTRTAAATLMALGYEKTLILASTKLHKQWIEELNAVGVPNTFYMLMSKEKLARMHPRELKDFFDNELIIIDEAHQGLKNNRTKLYRNLAYIKAMGEKNMKGLLLTATPWNNARSDVFNLGRLFLDVKNIPTETAYHKYLRFGIRKASKAIEVDDRAFAAFWRDLFLQRTRKTFGGQDVEFAERNFPVVEVVYEPVKERAFAANYERIGNLNLPYMNPIRYAQATVEEYDFTTDRLKFLFLKRADSSWPAFKSTLLKIKGRLQATLDGLGRIPVGPGAKELLGDWLRKQYELQEIPPFEMSERDELDEILEYDRLSVRNQIRYLRRMEDRIAKITNKGAKAMVKKMMLHCSADLGLLQEILGDLEAAFTRKDEKYEALRAAVTKCLESGEKILLITQFQDTAFAFYERLKSEPNLATYRMGLVTGQTWKIGDQILDSKEIILERFSPVAKGRPDLAGSADELDLVIGTETLSIGQNLQDCRVLMNIDLPFNPMNLEQRIGRIDRPRSAGQVADVDIFTFPSMPVIEAELRMMERLERKLKGIYEDTQFDDLVLPHYKDFLYKVLQGRKAEGADVAAMLDRTVEDSIVDVSADEHSVAYLDSQKRMRNAIETAHLREERHGNYVIDDTSLSTIGQTVLVAKIVLRDVNGKEIEEYLRPVLVDEDSYLTDLSCVEGAWHEAQFGAVRSINVIPVGQVNSERRNLQQTLRDKVLKDEVETYNGGVELDAKLEKTLIDSEVRKVIGAIQGAIRGLNKQYYHNKILAAGCDAKSVNELLLGIQSVDKRYDVEGARAVGELYRNLDQLWDNFGYYYDLFTEGLDEEGAQLRQSVREASLKQSSIEWVVGNIFGLPLQEKLL